MRRWLAWWVAVACAACVARGARELRVLQPDARWSFHVGIAAPPSAAGVVRAFNRTLADVSHTYLAGDYPPHLRRNITLQPLYIELPEDERFRARVLVGACAALGGRRVAALLVVGAGPAAAAVTLAAARAGVPVLRAAPRAADFRHSIGTDLLPLEVRLEVTARETLSAIRATLLHTHWHSFTMLAEADISSTLSLRKDLLAILTEPPLNPTFLPLPHKYSRHALFRRLADVSRSTRGVVVLICDIHYIQLVMDEAKRLNMLDGHFVWLWIDATQKIDVFHNIGNKTQNSDDDHEAGRPKGKNYDDFERKKRSGKADDDPPAERGASGRRKRVPKMLSEASEDSAEVNIRNNTFYNARASVVNKDDTKLRSKTHSVNDKIDSLSELYDSRNSSLYDINNNIVKNKGVETSKVERKLNEKVKSFVSDNRSYRRNVKVIDDYIGGDVHNVDVSNNDVDVIEVDRGDLLYKNVVSTNDVTKELYTSDNSDVELNPTVHTLTMNSLRDIPEKRKDRFFSFNKYAEENPEERARNLSIIFNSLPVGLLALHPLPVKTDRWWVRGAVRLAAGALRRVLGACDAWSAQAQFQRDAAASCWDEPTDAVADFSAEFVRELRVSAAATLAGGTERPDRALTAAFDVLNLVVDADAGADDAERHWRSVGRVLGRAVRLHTIVWPGGDIVVSGLSARARSVFRVVTARAPPFVMEGELDEDGQCLRGVPCHRLHTNDKDNLTLAFNEMETQERLEEEEESLQESYFPALGAAGALHENRFFEEHRSKYTTHCCYGLAMDLLENIAEELEFDFHLYIVNDGLYGSRRLTKKYKRVHQYRRVPMGADPPGKHDYRYEYRHGYTDRPVEEEDFDDTDSDKWNGIIGDLVSGAAHMSFAALSVSSARAEVVDFSQPYFFSEVSCLAAPTQKSEIPLLAFLLPFSPELWIAIFTSLNVTAIAVAIYEWLSPFGLNPWGRQRSKNFSISSALWVMWGLLCGHLVAFKAPKSWPNKFLINVWGGFSVIFVASYTANIAALIAGLFFHNAVDNYQDRSLLSVRVGAPRASAAEYYVRRDNPPLAQHMRAYSLQDVEEGIIRLRNGSLDLLMADTPILDYYRATDHGCKLQRVGEPLTQDTYAIGMAKGFPLKDSISALISKYSSNGYMDILHEKWYGGLPCFKLATDYGIQPRPLGVAAVAGVFILLGVGVVVGCLILCLEHLFYKYTLPVLRHQPKGTIWRSRNIMFFSQKLYRFINCVELVSPHHAARELVHTLRQGQITSLFQKSVKRKEHEQRRRRRSKAQFFEMIQEIRRVQQEERDMPLDPIKEVSNKPEEGEVSTLRALSPRNLRAEGRIRSPKLFGAPFRSPRPRNHKRKNVGGLNVRRFSTDSILGSDSSSIRESYERTSLNIGRRLSRDVDCLSASPPDINSRRSSYLDVVGGQRRDTSQSPSPSMLHVANPGAGATRSFTDVSDSESGAGAGGGGHLAPYSSAAELRARSPVRRAFSQATAPVARAPVEIRVSEAELPPAPPYPRLAQPGARSELSRLPEEELVRLWRSSEREVRSALLAALQERRADDDPEPG